MVQATKTRKRDDTSVAWQFNDTRKNAAPSFAPASAARVALRWADGTELSATTDADGVVRLSVPPERADPHAAPAALIVDDRRIRDIHPGAVGAP
jgi:hypothetical protein